MCRVRGSKSEDGAGEVAMGMEEDGASAYPVETSDMIPPVVFMDRFWSTGVRNGKDRLMSDFVVVLIVTRLFTCCA